ncbi:UPF0481 protein At3g47200-like [Macadamia integrifolia]|uniref:UPF0481 protein At3g47200-like n=1 Tax=Macadamia integrifolia TaxID=60698 RepID=UPI001C4EC10B|nr:UPF0481 protein At3g47200-like [Macadamia integrifolia]
MANAAAASFSKNNDDEIRIMVNSIEKERVGVCSLLSVNSIFRVPPLIRKLRPEAYTPQLVSIGPLHYNEEHLQLMQSHKLRYLNHFLDRQKGKKTLDDYVKAVSEVKEDARKCYSETTGKGFQEDEFVKIMVIDGCFILEFLEINKRRERDDLVSNDLLYWEILQDLINLENQLPFCVLKCLYDKTYEGLSTPNTMSQEIYESLLRWFVEEFHGPAKFPSIQFPEGEPKHILGLLQKVLIKSSTRSRKESKMELDRTSCASKLKGAGVKFQKAETSLFDINFDKGELTIPTIVIVDSTEHILRNLIAFEHYQEETRFFSIYATFMDGLIDTHRDVELLEEEGIIENKLGNPEDVVTLFNNIVKHVVNNDTYFSGVIEDVEKYQKKLWNRWRESLIENYFNTPWALISFIAALFLLIFTLGQTICSILQVVWTKP